MTESEQYFLDVKESFLNQNKEAEDAKMMSAPGVGFGTKVFAFYFRDAMIFKLGKDFVPQDEGISNWDYLNPFKNKPPMKAWFVIPFEGGKQYWKRLCEKAFENIQK